jgi:hypothetical protein
MNPERPILHSQPSVVLHIERLVLDGLPVSHGQSASVQAAVETELARLLSQQGVSSSSAGALTRLAGGSIQLTHKIQPAHLGHQIAAAVHTSLAPKPISQSFALPRNNGAAHAKTKAQTRKGPAS